MNPPSRTLDPGIERQNLAGYKRSKHPPFGPAASWHSRRHKTRLAYAIVICSLVSGLGVGPALAQIGSPPAATEAPNTSDARQNAGDGHARWTESLGEPSIYVEYARREVDQKRFKSAARNLRKAATILADKMKYAYGLDRTRLSQDVAALRLTARDVGAGAITTPAQLDSVLTITHSYLRERGTASQ